nr:hypothetical protein [Candidatus Sigynarchaeota archaeon]
MGFRRYQGENQSGEIAISSVVGTGITHDDSRDIRGGTGMMMKA